MSIVAWLLLTAAVASATILGGTFYFHWSWRYQRQLLGVIVEVALACTIAFTGLAGLAALWEIRPWA